MWIMLQGVATVLIVLTLVVCVAAIFGDKLGRPIERTPSEVATFLREFIEGTGGEWDWDDFESLRIADHELDQVRREAMEAGPPHPDLEKLRELLRRVEGMERPEG
jgi:hypothetical protein